MKTLEEKYIEDLIWRTNKVVVEIMKKIPDDELFGWKNGKM